jgi:hypothetical protein
VLNHLVISYHFFIVINCRFRLHYSFPTISLLLLFWKDGSHVSNIIVYSFLSLIFLHCGICLKFNRTIPNISALPIASATVLLMNTNYLHTTDKYEAITIATVHSTIQYSTFLIVPIIRFMHFVVLQTKLDGLNCTKDCRL